MENMWQQIYNALRTDFSDLPDAGQVTHVVVRLVLAALLGGLLGWQRERVGKSAGLRTHMLVALAAAFFILAPQQAGMSDADRLKELREGKSSTGMIGEEVYRSDDGGKTCHQRRRYPFRDSFQLSEAGKSTQALRYPRPPQSAG